MLRALGIRNFVLITDATIEVGPGLTVLTGETGAGKTLLTQALELLLGERATDDLIGPGSDEAQVQAIYDLEPDQVALLPSEVVDMAGLEPGELIATRRLTRGGKNRCYLNDTACTLGTLGDALRPLLAFSGQHEHRRLLDPGYQRAVLDALAGEHTAGVRRSYREAWHRTRESEARLEEARVSREDRRRERELLEFQVAELEQAALSEEEEAELVSEQRRLARAEEILEVTANAAEVLSSDGGQRDATQAVGEAGALLARISDVDERLEGIGRDVSEAVLLLEDAARRLRSYASLVEIDPQRLAEVEERLRTYADLSRKYGGTTAAAVAFAREGRGRLEELDQAEWDLSSLERSVAEGRGRCLKLAAELSGLRRRAGPLLEEAIERHLADLGMRDTVVEVAVRTQTEWEGLGPEGADQVEIMVAPNAGLPLRSLRRTASGGELSRTLLAIKAALAGHESRETLIFDEIDAGIGGRTATAVGAKLKSLSRENQLLVVTHLAQVAAYADQHILIEKARQGNSVVTRLTPLTDTESLDELCRMMGGETGDSAALDHARRLRDRAAAGLID